MSLADNLSRIQNNIADALNQSGNTNVVTIVAVTKTHPAQTIQDSYDAGILNIGENRIQEAEGKFTQLPEMPGLTKRMIGHLQSNKAVKAVKLFDTIDSIHSLKLANKISTKAKEIDKVIPALLEVNTSGEPQKSGFNPTDIENLLTCLDVENIHVNGLMTVGPLTRDIQQIRTSFILLRSLMEKINNQRPDNHPPLTELSMGMSGDYRIAIEEGSTMIRLGTALFGQRNYFQKQG